MPIPGASDFLDGSRIVVAPGTPQVTDPDTYGTVYIYIRVCNPRAFSSEPYFLPGKQEEQALLVSAETWEVVPLLHTIRITDPYVFYGSVS